MSKPLINKNCYLVQSGDTFKKIEEKTTTESKAGVEMMELIDLNYSPDGKGLIKLKPDSFNFTLIAGTCLKLPDRLTQPPAVKLNQPASKPD